ncbi:hypothetical protein RI367_002014 [Sorochytrium milnesiophthora]
MFHSDGSTYPKTYQMTLHCDFMVKLVNIPDSDTSVELFLYDVAGNDAFTDEVARYCENASAFAILYDVTDKDSFANIGKWLKIAQKIRPAGSPLIGCLIATKIDVQGPRRVISPQRGQETATSLGLEYFEVSSAKSMDVESPFYYMAGAFNEAYEEHLIASAH